MSMLFLCTLTTNHCYRTTKYTGFEKINIGNDKWSNKVCWWFNQLSRKKNNRCNRIKAYDGWVSLEFKYSVMYYLFTWFIFNSISTANSRNQQVLGNNATVQVILLNMTYLPSKIPSNFKGFSNFPTTTYMVY